MLNKNDAVIVDVLRTAGGKRGGALSGWHPADLAGTVLSALVDRNGLDPGMVDDVIMGCVTQVGRQSLNVGRNAVLAAGFPDTVPATTLDRQCGSSQQAAHFAAQGVIAAAYDIVIAGGVEVMSSTPMGSSRNGEDPFGESVRRRFEPRGGLVGQGISAELIAAQWQLSREELDNYGLESHRRAASAQDAGRFDREIVGVERRLLATGDGAAQTGEIHEKDEGVRPSSSLAALAKLKPAFKDDGVVTAGTSSQICDGASAALIMSAKTAEALNLQPRARFHTFAIAGVDPVMMLTGPIPATQKALEKSGLKMEDIDLFEVNEAFASVVLAWAAALGADLSKTNVNGGAIALGHPLGASGTRLIGTLLNELERIDGRYGLVTMCEGGGMANATIIERIS